MYNFTLVTTLLSGSEEDDGVVFETVETKIMFDVICGPNSTSVG